jgi:predicted RNase H-like HicB family nuclease
MLSFTEDLPMKKQTYSIRLRQVEGGYEALVPQLEVTAVGSTRDEAVDNVLLAVSQALEAAELAKQASAKHKKTVA